MFKKWIFLSAFGFIAAHGAANPLSPTSPTPLTDTGTLLSTVVVGGTESGFLVVCNDQSNALTSIFSSDGMSWNSPTVTSIPSYTGIWTSGTSAGFMATFIGIPIGYSTAAPFGIFTSTQGNTWINETIIESSATIATPVTVSGTSAGFMATWLDADDANAYWSFTSDNGVTWSIPAKITTSGLVNTSPYGAVIVSGSSTGFLAAWMQTDHKAYTSFFNGSSWSSPAVIPMTINVGSDVWVSSNASGFMAVWTDESSNGYASFSSDNGSSWSTPVSFVSGVLPGTDISVSGTTSGFVVAWIGTDNNAYGSFSSDEGNTWSTPAQITTDGSVMGSFEDTSYGFVSVSAVGNGCVFAWLGNPVVTAQSNVLVNSGDIYASFSTISNGTNPLAPPANLTGSQKKNNAGLQYEYVNSLKWSPSPSTGVTGYNIYANGVLTKTLNVSTFKYEFHRQKPGTLTVYSVTAFDSSGNESSAATVTIN